MRKKIGMLLYVVIFLITFSNESYTSLLVGDEKGKIYYYDNIYEKHPLASLTKIMTLLVTYDEIKKGNISLGDEVEMSPEALSIKGSRIKVSVGEKITVEDLIKATAIYSANNAAYTLAEYVGQGDADRFVGMMNDKAKEIGLQSELEFHTPMGLPTRMTGKDMDMGTAKGVYFLSLEALKYNEYMDIASRKTENIKHGQYGIYNRNKMISSEKGIFGIKTGYHLEAGYNISVAAKRNGITTVTVVFGAPREGERYRVAERAIDEFYGEFQLKKIIDSENPSTLIEVRGGKKNSVYIYPGDDYEKVVSKNWDIKINRVIIEKIKAPINKDEILGRYQVVINGKIVKEGVLVAKEKIEKNSFFSILKK